MDKPRIYRLAPTCAVSKQLRSCVYILAPTSTACIRANPVRHRSSVVPSTCFFPPEPWFSSSSESAVWQGKTRQGKAKRGKVVQKGEVTGGKRIRRTTNTNISERSRGIKSHPTNKSQRLINQRPLTNYKVTNQIETIPIPPIKACTQRLVAYCCMRTAGLRTTSIAYTWHPVYSTATGDASACIEPSTATAAQQ